MKVQRLNLDNSWWLKLEDVTMLIDPWLVGTEVDYFKWFNEQWHDTKPIDFDEVPSYDVVLITQKYPDHFHLETLMRLQPKRLIGPKSIARKVRLNLPKCEFMAFEDKIKKPFGLGIDITFLPTNRKIDPIYDTLLVSCTMESVLIASHGAPYKFDPGKFDDVPAIKTVISPLNEYKLPFFLGGTVSPGVKAAEELMERTGAKYFLQTHDEDKHARGLVSKFARIVKAKRRPEDYPKSILGDKLIYINNYNPIDL